MKKSPAERSIEALTWASVVIWLGFMLVARALDQTWLIMMVLGIILLSSAIYQRSRQWETSLSIWIFGIWMAVFSVIETVNELIKAMNDGSGLNIDLGVYLGIALVSMGVAAILRTVQGPATPARTPDPYRTAGGSERDPRPQVVTDNYASGEYGVGPRAYRPGREWREGEGYLGGSQFGTQPPRGRSQYGDAPRGRTADYSYGEDPGRTQATRGQYDSRPLPGQDRGGYGDYDRATQRADYDDRSYEERPPSGYQRGYEYDQPSYRPENNPLYDEQPYEGGYYEDQDAYYDDPYWDRPPQVERPPRQAPRRQPPPEQEDRRPAPNDLDARVEDIIRRSRERRSASMDDMDLPY